MSCEKVLNSPLDNSASASLIQNCNDTPETTEASNIQAADAEYFNEDVMTSSYCEIESAPPADDDFRPGSSNEDISPPETSREPQKQRPNSLILLKSNDHEGATQSHHSLEDAMLPTESGNWVHRGQQTSDSQISLDGSPSLCSSEELYSSGHRRTGSDTSGLSELPGMLIVDGDVVTFVAEDLEEKIRMSSPLSRRDTPSFPSSRVSTPSLYKQAVQPQVPLVDAGALADLEAHAHRVASSLDNMLENLSGTVQSISSLTVDCMEKYEASVCKTCDAVDSNIKSMYQLMAKCEELSNSMKSLQKVSEEIKEIKRILDLFENIVEHKS